MHRNYFQNDFNIIKHFKIQMTLDSISILVKCSFEISIYIFDRYLWIYLITFTVLSGFLIILLNAFYKWVMFHIIKNLTSI